MKIHPGNFKDLFLAEEVPVDGAVKRAFEHALREHKSAGRSVSSWEDGRVVVIPPQEIKVFNRDDEYFYRLLSELASERTESAAPQPGQPGRPGAGAKPPAGAED